jgi:hypothetical protein
MWFSKLHEHFVDYGNHELLDVIIVLKVLKKSLLVSTTMLL